MVEYVFMHIRVCKQSSRWKDVLDTLLDTVVCHLLYTCVTLYMKLSITGAAT
jgi:hypothetical protein